MKIEDTLLFKHPGVLMQRLLRRLAAPPPEKSIEINRENIKAAAEELHDNPPAVVDRQNLVWCAQREGCDRKICFLQKPFKSYMLFPGQWWFCEYQRELMGDGNVRLVSPRDVDIPLPEIPEKSPGGVIVHASEWWESLSPEEQNRVMREMMES